MFLFVNYGASKFRTGTAQLAVNVFCKAKRFSLGKVEKGSHIAKGYRHALYHFELSDRNTACVKRSEKFQFEASLPCRQTFMTDFSAVQDYFSHEYELEAWQ